MHRGTNHGGFFARPAASFNFFVFGSAEFGGFGGFRGFGLASLGSLGFGGFRGFGRISAVFEETRVNQLPVSGV